MLDLLIMAPELLGDAQARRGPLALAAQDCRLEHGLHALQQATARLRQLEPNRLENGQNVDVFDILY